MDESEFEFLKFYHEWFVGTADQAVLLMFGLAFSVYVVAVQGHYPRYLIRKFYHLLLALMVIGNGFVLFLIVQMSERESQVIAAMKEVGCASCDSGFFREFISSGFDVRVGLTVANIAIYFSVITLIRKFGPDRPFIE